MFINSYIASSGYSLIDCDLNGLSTNWFVDIRINDIVVVSLPFFNGNGYYIPFYSSPSTRRLGYRTNDSFRVFASLWVMIII